MSLDSGANVDAAVEDILDVTLPAIETGHKSTAKSAHISTGAGASITVGQSTATMVSRTVANVSKPPTFGGVNVPLWAMVALSALLFVCLLMQLGCANKPTATAGGDAGADPMASEAELDARGYNDLILRNTRHDQQYDGVYNKFEVYATFLNSRVQTAVLKKKGEAFQWSAKQLQTEREKLFQENSTQTKFALSFYVPSVRLNDLNKGSSIWKVYLEAGGQRYEGKASRRTTKLEDIISMFPYHNRWSTAYELVFTVPLSGVEVPGQPVTFIITSMQGTISLKY